MIRLDITRRLNRLGMISLLVMLGLGGTGLSADVLAQQTSSSASAPDSTATEAPQPQVSVSLDPPQVAPGESATLRITVLVPTYLPKPVVFPTIVQPNLRVLLPERATSPTSRRIDGKTWSGVSRSYRLIPLSPGDFHFRDQSVEVSYIDPNGGEAPLVSEIALAPLSLSASVPDAAAGLDPYIAASSIELQQTLSVVHADDTSADNASAAGGDQTAAGGETSRETLIQDLQQPVELDAGDSLRRDVTATLEGGSVILLPALLDESAPHGLGVYPTSPKVDESATGGSRTESVTYVAEGGGEGQLPAVTLRWFNPESGRIDQATLPPIEVKVSGPALPRFEARGTVLPWLVTAAVAVIVLVLLGWLWWRWGRSAWQTRRQQQAIQRERSGHTALSRLRRATNAHQLPECQQAWRRLQGSAAILSRERIDAVEAALSTLGRLCYSSQGLASQGPISQALESQEQAPQEHVAEQQPSDSDRQQQLVSAWQALKQALPTSSELRSTRRAPALPPLNPTRSNA
ncbi:hypothetical protein [Halomonas cupida]|uniref:BatD family protein n=1 Tax=Halomonas cupida TaxID=44933 RepID=UPI003A907A5F